MNTLRFQSLTHPGAVGASPGMLDFQEKSGEPYLWVGATGHGARWVTRELLSALDAGARTPVAVLEAAQAGIRAFRQKYAQTKQHPCHYPDGAILEGFGVLLLDRRGGGQALSRGRFRFCQVRSGGSLQPLPESAGFEALSLQPGDYLIANPENAEIVLPIREALTDKPQPVLPEILRAQPLPFALVFAVGETAEPTGRGVSPIPVLDEKKPLAVQPGLALTGAVLLLALLLGGWLYWQKPWQSDAARQPVERPDSSAVPLPEEGSSFPVDSTGSSEAVSSNASFPDLMFVDSMLVAFRMNPDENYRQAIMTTTIPELLERARSAGADESAVTEKERQFRQELEAWTIELLEGADRQYHLAEAYIQDGKNEKARQALDAARQGYRRYLNLKPDQEESLRNRLDKVQRLTALASGDGDF